MSETDAAPPAVQLSELRKSYGRVRAVDGITLRISEGEFFGMLGPSGSGKTTTLRLIAGFERPETGRVELGGTDVTGAAPFQRDANTVFQDFALFPHMNVADNIGYGLAVRGVAKPERRTRVADALAMVRLDGYEQRAVTAMSGGQRQRVALARALVNRPKVLLLDEPLGALDAKLREEMQVELKAIQREVGITFVFVTHDQAEALAMSDRIAVFSDGHIEQVGTPQQVYQRPASRFVASFVGSSNLLRGELAGAPDSATEHLIRPERIEVTAADAPGLRAAGTVREVVYLGATVRLEIVLDGGETLIAARAAGTPATAPGGARGDRVGVRWDDDAVLALPETANTADPADMTDAPRPR